MKVRNAINTSVVHIPERATLQEAANSMYRHDVSVLVVVSENGQPSGMLTDGELIEKATVSNPATTRVADAMAQEIIGCVEDVDADEALQMMLMAGLRHLPVFDRESRLLGFVSAQLRTHDIH